MANTIATKRKSSREVAGQPPSPDMVWIPGGTFLMGSNDFYPDERPTHEVAVNGFWIDPYEVTNENFARFVEETGYVTTAEIAPRAEDYPGAKPELLVPGSMVFQKTHGPVDLSNWANWWAWVPGANWRHPEGPASTIEQRMNYPVVHVAYADVEAYCVWAHKTIPTEEEWEYAARGGMEGKIFTWGNEHFPEQRAMANAWQGEFPWQNLLVDGFEGTSPVGAFPPNGYGLYDMAGNVWEWTSDWYVPRHPADKVKSCCSGKLSPLAAHEQSFDPNQPEFRIPRKVLKGGSHLCAPNYCLRYRPAARSPQMIDTAMSHIGVRCVVRRGRED
jgi:formylglycine-generating enzyme